MQIPGKILVLATFGIGVAMAAGAWWYNYQQSYRTAEFWGFHDAALLVGDSQLALLTLDSPADKSSAVDSMTEVIAGRIAIAELDLTDKQGLVHLRHSLTYDGNFDWDQRGSAPSATANWAYALRFSKAEARPLVVVFTQEFNQLGRVDAQGRVIEVLPCPKLGPVIREYLRKVGVRLQ